MSPKLLSEAREDIRMQLGRYEILETIGQGASSTVFKARDTLIGRIVAIKTMILTQGEAAGFYAIHKERPFFPELTAFMSSGKIFALVLEAEGAIQKWRDTMGATDPKKAAPGTIRCDLGASIGNNCTHGSDAPETAAFEISYFFSGLELI